jgi:ElaB/YqjD/DUF883 family membrane-anchored ribosome-binding protein
MNTNKFLQNLNQSAGQLPATTPPGPDPVAARRGSPDGYDPIQRLTDELSRHSRALEGVVTRFDQLEQRPQAATVAEWQTLLAEAQSGVRYAPNSERIAQALLPHLLAGLPNTDQLRTAASAGAGEIKAAGDAAARRIEQATATGATRIEGASKRKADDYAHYIGFTSWQSALAVGVLIGLMIVLVNYQSHQQAEKIAQAQLETQAVREFTNWAKNQPEGKRLYEQYYNR